MGLAARCPRGDGVDDARHIGLRGKHLRPPFIVGATLIGVGHALVHVSRQSQVVEIVPDQYRARGLTTLAGIWRIANFVGPLVGALVIHQRRA